LQCGIAGLRMHEAWTSPGLRVRGADWSRRAVELSLHSRDPHTWLSYEEFTPGFRSPHEAVPKRQKPWDLNAPKALIHLRTWALACQHRLPHLDLPPDSSRKKYVPDPTSCPALSRPSHTTDPPTRVVHPITTEATRRPCTSYTANRTRPPRGSPYVNSACPPKGFGAPTPGEAPPERRPLPAAQTTTFQSQSRNGHIPHH